MKYMISVIIPMYNAEKTIIASLNSVINQSYKENIEIIVVNDGSKDNGQKVVEQFVINNPTYQITLINKENGGVSKARNTGMKLAKGDWIALLDSDDEWLLNKLEKQIEVLDQNPEIDFLGTNRNDEVFNTFLCKKMYLITKISPKLLLVKNFFPTPTVIFKRIILTDIGFFDENQKYAEEGNYFIRIAQKYNSFLLNESLVITGGGKDHFGHSGLSGNLKEMEKGELKNLNDALNLKIINIFEFVILVFYSILKYIRRLVIVKLRK